MRRVFVVLCSAALVAAAAAAAVADGYVQGFPQNPDLPENTAYFFFSSQNHKGSSDNLVPLLFLGSTSIHAPGPQYEPRMEATSSSPWTVITTILLNNAGDLSGGLTLPAGNANYGYSSADGDVTWLMPAFGGPIPPGTFNDYSGSTGWGPNPSTDWQRPAHSNYQISAGDYYLPNTAVYYDQPGNPYLQFQFDIMAWTGNHSSFAAAVRDPTCWVGDAGPFQPVQLDVRQ